MVIKFKVKGFLKQVELLIIIIIIMIMMMMMMMMMMMIIIIIIIGRINYPPIQISCYIVPV